MVKNFKLDGVGVKTQLGKKGGFIEWDDASSSFKMTTNDGTTAADLIVAATPSDDAAAASKKWVQDEIAANVQGLDVKESVAAVTTGALVGTYFHDSSLNDSASTPVPNGGKGDTFTMTANGALTVDGVALAAGDRVLLKDQTAGEENGIYYVKTLGDAGTPTVLERTDDANNHPGYEVTTGMFLFASGGTVNGGNGWVLTGNDANGDGIFDLGNAGEPLVFTQFSGAGQVDAGDGLGQSGNTLFVNVDGDTVKIVGDTIQAGGTSTTGEILISDGSGGSAWGALNLAEAGSITGVLPTEHGGVGLDTSGYTGGEMLVGSAGGLQTLSQPADGDDYVLRFNDTTNAVEWVAQSEVGGFAYSTMTFEDSSSVNATTTGDSLAFTTGTASLDGIQVVSPSADTIRIGLDVAGLTAAGANLLGTDELIVASGGSNLKMTGQELADGVASLVSLDQSEIKNASGSVKVDTDSLAGAVEVYTDVGSSATKLVEMAATVGSVEGRLTNAAGEFRIEAGDGTGFAGSSTADTDIRLVPGAGGQVFIGEAGDGEIQADDDSNLTVLGGDAGTTGAGELYLGGGNGVTGVDSGNGGDVVLFGGAAAGGANGKVYYPASHTAGTAYTPVAGDEVATISDLNAGVDLTSLTSTAATTSDTVTFYDADAADANVKRTFGELINDLDLMTTAGITDGVIYKTADDTYVAGTFAATTNLGLAVTDDAGTGTVSYGIDFANIPAQTIDTAADDILFNDATDGRVKKTSAAALVGDALGNYYQTITGDSGSSTADNQTDSLAIVGGTDGGILTTAGDVSGVDVMEIALHVDQLATGANTILSADSFALYDSTGTATVKKTFGDMITDLTIVQEARQITTTATSGLAGGSDLSADVDLTLDISALGAAALVDANELAFDDGTAANKKITWASMKTQLENELSLDTTRIVDAAGSTFVDTDNTAGVVEINANDGASSTGVKVAEFKAAQTNTSDTYFTFTQDDSATADEVRIEAHNAAGTGDVDIRLVPQDAGQVFIGDTGAGIIQADDDFTLTVKGGNFAGGQAGAEDMSMIIEGGDGGSGAASGDVFLRPGADNGGGSGAVYIQDDAATDGTSGNIAVFMEGSATADSWFKLESADSTSGALKLSAATDAGSENVDIELAPLNSGKLYYGDSTDANNEVATVGTVANNTDSLVRRATITADGSASYNIGATLAGIAGKTYHVDRIIIEVTSAFNDDTGATISESVKDFADAATDFDLTALGTYVVDVPMTQTTTGSEQFVLNAGAGITSGTATVSVQYRVI